MQTNELIQKVVVLLGLEQTANQLNVTEKSLKNWLGGAPLTREKALHESLEIILRRIANPIRSTSADFTFIDLFAGVEVFAEGSSMLVASVSLPLNGINTLRRHIERTSMMTILLLET